MLSRLGLPVSQRISSHIVVGVCITVIVFNLLEALQLAYLWNALKWEPETEWDEWRISGIRVVVGLVCGYLFWTCCAAFVGLVGAIKLRPSYLRFFRDCTIVDIVFAFMFTLITALAGSQQATRAVVCEQLSRQPELLRSVANSGLNFENCELWFENAVVVFTCVMLITLVMRIQFTFTLSHFYTRILRKHRMEALDTAPRRILLLPQPSTSAPLPEDNIPLSSSSELADPSDPLDPTKQQVVVYAPVRHTLETAHELGAVEAWVSNHRHHGHSRSHSSRTGRIHLDVRPGEGLLPDLSARSSTFKSTSPGKPSGSRTVDRDAQKERLDSWRFDRASLKRA